MGHFGIGAFWRKMGLIVLAGINALAFENFVYRRVRAGHATAEESVLAKVTSGLSLMFRILVRVRVRYSGSFRM